MASIGLTGLILGGILKVARLKMQDTFEISDIDFNATKESLSYRFNLKMDFNHYFNFHILDMKFTDLYKHYENNLTPLVSLIRQGYSLCDRNICEIDFRGNTLMLSLSYTIAGRKIMQMYESGLLNQEVLVRTLERYLDYSKKNEALIARCIAYKD